MIRELITYLSARCRPHVRSMGYLYEAIAMRERYGRHQPEWQHHIDNTKAFLLSAAERTSNKDKMIILGSGLLADVPLGELTGLFKDVVLADIVHLPEIKKRIRHYPNARLVEHDAAGISERLFHNAKNGNNELPLPLPDLPEKGADLVVSLNMLSQLPVVPHIHALKNMPGLNENDLESWCRLIIETHVSWLGSLDCSTCLISDTAYLRKDRGGEILEQGSTLYGFALPEPEKSWVWNLAPLGEEASGTSKELLVCAWSKTN